MMVSQRDLAWRAMDLSRQINMMIHPMLAGEGPDVQGACLADLVATWLAGHPPVAREELLQLHVDKVRELIPVNEKIMFGERGHPQSGAT